MTPIHTSQTTDDGAGDTETLTVDYNPNPDGTFTYDVTISYSYGTPPTPGATIADDETNTNGGSGSFHFGMVVGLTSVSFSMDEEGSGSYNIDVPLTGPSGSGTWTDFGHNSFDAHDSVTIKDDGTVSETHSADSTSSDKYQFTASGTTADGKDFTYGDGGSDSSSYDDSGSDSSDGTSSDKHDEDDTDSETITLGESGGDLKVSAKSTETVGYHDHGAPTPGTPGATSDTATTTDDGTDTSSYQNKGTINGASFTVSDNQADSYDDSDKLTTGSTAGKSEDKTRGGSNTETFKLTLSGVDDSSGSGSSSGSSSSSGSGSSPDATPTPTDQSDGETETDTSGGTYQEHDTTGVDSTGAPATTIVTKATATSSGDESGTDPSGAFSVTGDGTFSDEITATSGPSGYAITGETKTASPPDGKVTGTPPEDLADPLPLKDDVMRLSDAASSALPAAASAVALMLTGVQVPAPGQTSAGQPPSFADFPPYNDPFPYTVAPWIDWHAFFGNISTNPQPSPQQPPSPAPQPPAIAKELLTPEQIDEMLQDLDQLKPQEGQYLYVGGMVARDTFKTPFHLKYLGVGVTAPGDMGLQILKYLEGGGSFRFSNQPDEDKPGP